MEDELNVDRVEATDELGDVLAYELVPNFKLLGPASASGSRTCAPPWPRWTGRPRPPTWRRGGRWWWTWPTGRSSWWARGGAAGAGPARVRRVAGRRRGPRPRPGLDDDLRRRGLAREVIRNVQDLRKETGLEVSDYDPPPPGRPRRPRPAVRRDRPRGAGRRRAHRPRRTVADRAR